MACSTCDSIDIDLLQFAQGNNDMLSNSCAHYAQSKHQRRRQLYGSQRQSLMSCILLLSEYLFQRSYKMFARSMLTESINWRLQTRPAAIWPEIKRVYWMSRYHASKSNTKMHLPIKMYLPVLTCQRQIMTMHKRRLRSRRKSLLNGSSEGN